MTTPQTPTPSEEKDFKPPFHHMGYTVLDSEGNLFAIAGPAQGENPTTTALASLIAQALNEKRDRDDPKAKAADASRAHDLAIRISQGCKLYGRDFP